jgi:hypothetical protein
MNLYSILERFVCQKPIIKTPMKVLFILKERISYGISYGLRNSATFVSEALDGIGYCSKVVTVLDGNGVDAEIYKFKPDVAIIEALWVTPEKLAELAAKYPKTKFIVRLHSAFPFLQMEGIAMPWIQTYLGYSRKLKNIFLSVNRDDVVEDMIAVTGYHNWVYTPNVYFPDNLDLTKTPPRKSSVHIGCFGAVRPLKNILQQAVAAMRFADAIGKKLSFYVNSDRVEQEGSNVLKNIRALFGRSNRHFLIEVPWQNHTDFMKTVSQMDIVMGVSLTETFNICLADAVSIGVPVVGSDEIYWLSPSSLAHPTDTEDTIKVLKRAYKSTNLPKKNTKTLFNWSKNALKQWDKMLRSL